VVPNGKCGKCGCSSRLTDRSNVVDGSAFGALSACTFTVGRLAVEGAFLWPTTTAFAGPRTPPSLVAPQHEPLAAAGNHALQQRVLGRRVRYLYHRRNDDAPVRRPRGGDPGARLLQSLQVGATGMWRIEDDEGQAAPRGLVPAAALEG